MTRDNAYTGARTVALKNKVDTVVVLDPIGNAEDSFGPYGYCPKAAVDTLFPHREKAHDYFIEYYGGAKPLFEYSAKELASWTADAVKKG